MWKKLSCKSDLYYCSKVIILFLFYFQQIIGENYTFGIIPKRSNYFYTQVYEGCRNWEYEKKRTQNGDVVKCKWLNETADGRPIRSAKEQTDLIQNILNREIDVDGIGISVFAEDDDLIRVLNKVQGEKRLVLFENDVGSVYRHAFVGSDPVNFGENLAKVVSQTRSDVGSYGIITSSATIQEFQNLTSQVETLQKLMEKRNWNEVKGSPFNCQNNPSLALDLFKQMSDKNTDLVISLGPWLMQNSSEYIDAVKKYEDTGVISAVTDDHQFNIIRRGYANALLGEASYLMGKLCMEKLYNLTLEENGSYNDGLKTGEYEFTNRNIQVIRFSHAQEVNNIYLGNYKIYGYASFVIIQSICIGVLVWIYRNRDNEVIQRSQPMFLNLICFGVMLERTVLLFHSNDDDENSLFDADHACKSIEWFISCGWTVIFSAMFAKLRCLFKKFQENENAKEIKLSMRELLLPCVLFLMINITVLLVRLFVTPPKFKRKTKTGMDAWSEVQTTYGTCWDFNTTDATVLFTLAVFNSLLISILYRVGKTWHIKVEYNEPFYMGVASMCMLQGEIISIPTLLTLNNEPLTFYIVLMSINNLQTINILVCIFGPKWYYMSLLREKERQKTKNNR